MMKNISLPGTGQHSVCRALKLDEDSLYLRTDSSLLKLAGECSRVEVNLALQHPQTRLRRPEKMIVIKSVSDVDIVGVGQTKLSVDICGFTTWEISFFNENVSKIISPIFVGVGESV